MRVALLVYGIVVGIYGVTVLDKQIPNAAVMMDARARPIAASIRELDRGGPPLWTTSVETCGKALACPTAPADDQGIFLYLPLAGHFLHISDPYVLIKWFQIVLTTTVVVIYPLVFYEIFGSVLVAIAAPFVVLTKMSIVEDTEVYFAMAWAVLLGLPALFALHGRTSRTARALLVVVVVAAAIASTIRLHAGLPILLGALLSTWLTAQTLRSKLAMSVLLVAAYFPVLDIPYDVARYRDAVTGTSYTSLLEGQHGIWHSIYIGLGYLPNPYGITFNDNAGDVAAHRVDPNVVFGTREYQEIMRGVVLDLARRDPGFILANIVVKTGAAGVAGLDLLGPVGLAVPLMLLVGKRRRSLRTLALIAAPAVLITLSVPVLYVPYPQYTVGWLATVGVVWMIAAGWTVLVLTEAWRYASTRPDEARRQAKRIVEQITAWRPRPLQIAIVVIVAILASAAGIVAYQEAASARLVHFYGQQAAQPMLASDLRGQDIRSWSFTGAGQNPWTLFKGVAARQQGGALQVTTNDEPLDYQMQSPLFTLEPGRYVAAIDGQVVSGGLYVGVFDANAARWLDTKYYWSGQSQDGRLLVALVDLPLRTNVRVILSNWAPDRRPSEWLVRGARVVRTG